MKAGSIFQDIACRIGKHRLFIVKQISDEAALVECNHCRNQWAMKMEGEFAGSMIPWKSAELFYTDEKIRGYLYDKR